MKTLGDSFKYIKETYKKVSALKDAPLDKPSEWLADNFYILEQEEEEIRSAFKAADKKYIKFVSDESRVFHLAKQMVTQNKIRVDGQVVEDFLKKTVRAKRLSIEEIKIFLPEVKCAIFEKIALICRAIQKNKYNGGEDVDMANAIKSLVSLKDVDWGEEFYNLSPVEEILSHDKAGCYDILSIETRETYTRAISKIAAEAGHDETYVAQCLINLAQEGNGKSAHVGYYLIDKGQNTLRKHLGLKEKKQIKRPLIYMGLIFLMTSLTQTLIYIYTKNFWGGFWSGIPLFDIWQNIANYVCARLVKPETVPSVHIKGNIPDEGRTMIVYPVLLANKGDALKMADKLEVCYAANRDDNLRFALLGDFKDGERESEDEDNIIIETAKNAIEELNRKYGDRFFFLHRERKYNHVQQKWMGWERKRGALIALNRFLRGREGFKYVFGNSEKLSGIKYVITLDADTILPPGAAKKLIEAALHPLNRAVVDKEKGIVTEGYGIIAPRISVDIDSANKTMFSRIFAGQGGTDTYSSSVSDVYMDLGSEAVFTGKGLYDIDVFTECIENAIPDNSVLSHDLLESCFVRCAYFSGVEVFDSYPSSFLSNINRYHRWVRGDWQLLPWMLWRVRNKSGKMVKNHINYISRWKIGDNMRRSMVPILQFILIVGAISVFKKVELWLTIALLSICMPMFLYLISSLFSKSFFYVGEKRNSNIIYGFRSWIYQVTLTIMFLPHTAYISADAAVRTIIRVLFTRKNTLEWVTAAESDARSKGSLADHYGKMAFSVVFAVATIWLCASLSPHNMGIALIFSLVWCLSPMAAYIISKSETQSSALPQKGEMLLYDTARRIWRFFEEYMNEGDNYLPPDNIQMSPYKGAAHRTSPTNIGLGMMATLCAADMGFISPAAMAERIKNTLSTIEKMEKWKGHLYNWYDTKTLKPLLPRYISVVDSGNLLCYLMVCKKGISDYKKDIGDEADKIALRIDELCSAMSFKPLFCEKKKLFYIGYNIDENRYSASYYDLLASEVRQSVFLSVARGEVDKEAWFKLGRTLVSSDGYKGLLSWTGTMFEYLMPLLIMGMHKNTLLSETYFFAVRCNKKYARKRRVPWGVSESGYSELDVSQNYKYKAFGVPALGLKRGLSKDTVISPYSTMLALMVDKRAAVLNLLLLKRKGAMGEYGFYEAIDYTKERAGEGGRVVKSYMAHHQGMSLVAICNILNDNIMQKRFSSYPEVKAAQPLLWERVPVKVLVKKEIREQKRFKSEKPAWNTGKELIREYEGDKYALPAVNALSNGSYSLIIDRHGGGYSSLDGVRMNKFEPYNINEKTGHRIFIKDTGSGKITDVYSGKCVFSSHMAEYKTNEDDVLSNLEICISPEESGEARRLTIVNNSKTEKQLEVVSFMELSLSGYDAEAAHKAFSNLFVKTHFEDGVLYAERRARGDERTYTAYCSMVGPDESKIHYETDRAAFLGRANKVDTADMLYGKVPLKQSTGSVIDPCFAFSCILEIAAGESATLTLVSGLSENTEMAKAAAGRLRRAAEDNIFAAAYDKYKSERYIEYDEGDEQAFCDALPALIYGGYSAEETAQSLTKNRLSREELWKMGISGDYPIILFKVSQEEDEKNLAMLIRAYKFWRMKGILCDLVILCIDGGYQSPVFEMAKEAVKKMAAEAEDIPAGIKILSVKQLSEDDMQLLCALCRIYVDAAKGGLGDAIVNPEKNAPHIHENTKTDDGVYNFKLEFENGYGGFDTEKNEYIIVQNKRGKTPAPWINVVANKKFGFLSGEGGSGYTWHKNSRENRLTMWHNDTATDPVSEKLYIERGVDEYSPCAGVFGDMGAFYTRYGCGYTKYLRNTRGIEHEVTMFVPVDEAVKIIAVRLKNLSREPKKLKVIYKTEPVMGNNLSFERGKLTARILEGGTVAVRNSFSKTGEYMFLSAGGGTGAIYDSTANQKQGNVCAGKPIEIAAFRDIELSDGGEEWVVFTLGAGRDENECISLSQKYSGHDAALKALEDVQNYWQNITGSLKVKTNFKMLDIMLGSYLIYQAIACRMFGKSAHYQSGGAFGFRDQLQDSMAALYAAEHLTREQIILHACHQFKEGDVLHWWHPSDTGGMPRGVRTRFSDDRLWLAYLTAEYVKVTGDESILHEVVPFLIDDELSEGEDERYSEIKEMGEAASIYEHAVRAIDLSLKKGRNRLPLMGGGDWNDGMNKVGQEGKGESVWLAWFIIYILKKFVPICEKMNDDKRASLYRQEIEKISCAAEETAWDGEWYRRAFFDDGSPLGSAKCSECTIDSISQSWAVISGAADKTRAETAMQSAEKMLYDKQSKIIKLLTPPFEKRVPSPGYIKGYLPGIRENGGQYTHAAIWFAIAFSCLGDNDKALELFEQMCPITHSKTEILANIYKTEPYVMAADVYSMPPHTGRGGWTWYTGAAVWMYKLGLEYILGFTKEGNEVYFSGKMPKQLNEYEVKYRYGSTQYIFKVKRGKTPNRITLKDDGGVHEVTAFRQ